MVAIAVEEWCKPMIQRHFEQWFIVGLTEVPSGFPPPHDTQTIFTDKQEVKGLFKLDRSTEAMVAMAQGIETRARLIVESHEPIDVHDTLRRVSTGIFYAIDGDPKVALPEASAQIKSYTIYEVDRPATFQPRPVEAI